ncbi:microfibril-associated glycoprotein 4-like [Ostrea edulis]|uniref:microfibril-associated glycoprotein 4-like n=1 Tax=Ostrea edulis TaxID=37623 RepID=UPI0024AFFEC0|nr:microfibril-associated glycoprotein 4-like [Ostrea edulis]
MGNIYFLVLVPLVVGHSLLTDSEKSGIGSLSVNTRTAVDTRDDQILVNQETSIKLPTRDGIHFKSVSTTTDFSTDNINRTNLEGIQKEIIRIRGQVKEFHSDCQDVLWSGGVTSGVYIIYPRGGGPLKVFCDQETLGGGWTVIQRRLNGSVDFFRGWNEYKYGFGDSAAEYWIGNHRIYELISQGFYELRIDMEDFADQTRYASYKRFGVGSEDEGYSLKVMDYEGNAGDSLMSHHNGAKFHTKDNDIKTCSTRFKGAWWYKDCHTSNLNGQYLIKNHSSFADGINWKAWHGYHYSLKETAMKIRRL